jgi:hypothetical protein
MRWHYPLKESAPKLPWLHKERSSEVRRGQGAAQHFEDLGCLEDEIDDYFEDYFEEDKGD